MGFDDIVAKWRFLAVKTRRDGFADQFATQRFSQALRRQSPALTCSWPTAVKRSATRVT